MTRSAPLFRSLVALVLTLLVACSGADLDHAERQLDLGNVDVAERLIGDAQGPRADRLRERIAQRRAARESVRADIESAAALPAAEAIDVLRAIERRGDLDPVARDWVEVALSEAHDRKAVEARTGGHETAEFFTEQTKRGARANAGKRLDEAIVEGDGEPPAVLQSVLEEVRGAIADGRWRRAETELDMIVAPNDGIAAELRRLRLQVSAGARAEADRLLSEASEIEERDGIVAARDHLRSAVQRFPRGGDIETLFEELDDLEDRAELIALADAAEPGSAPEEGFRSDAPLHIRAGAHGRVGDLRRALDLWLEAAVAAGPGEERDRYNGRARWIEKRIELRQALIDARAHDPEAFAPVADAMNFEGIERGDSFTPWRDVGLGWFRRAVRTADLGDAGRVGLLAESVARGDWEDFEQELAVLLGTGAIEDADAWALLARRRGEEIPGGGYVRFDGRWMSAAEADSEALREALEEYETALVRANDEKRDEALEELLSHGKAARGAVVGALERRAQKAAERMLRDSSLRKLERVAEQRAELDAAREEALALIFDEEEYFYPYRPPECPPQKARLYHAVQQRVNELVGAVRDVWDAPRSARPSSALESTLDELRWCLASADRVGADLGLPTDVPDWVFHLDLEADETTLHGFAWDAAERARIDRDERVEAFNERHWERIAEEDPDRAAQEVERDQVRVTNGYRRMFGRRALAWNPLLQESTQMHSDYMSRTGEFGHYESEDPERRTPFDRMQLVGYDHGVSENCSLGRTGAEHAHLGWLQSSGHHRNILIPSHQEMASALSGVYWTQNYGVGTSFTSKLQ